MAKKAAKKRTKKIKRRRKHRQGVMYAVDIKRIKMILLRKNLTITEIAKTLQLSRQAVYDMMDSTKLHRGDTINKLADVLGVQPWEILGDEKSIIELEKKDKRRQKR